jgi:hypothetical protein
MPVNRTAVAEGPFIGNGVTTAFPIATMHVLSASEIEVRADNVLVSPSLYSVALGQNGAATVNFTTAPANGVWIMFYQNPRFTQPVNFENQGQFQASSHNEGLDRDTVRDQVLADGVARSVRVARGEAPLDPIEPVPGKFLVVTGSGQIGMSSGTGADAGLRTDLASSGGADLVGTTSDGRTVDQALSAVWLLGPPASAGDDTAALQARLDEAFAAQKNVEIPAGTYDIATSLNLPGAAAQRGRAIHIEGQGCGEAFVQFGIDGTVLRGTATAAPTFRYVPDVPNTGNGMAIVEKIRFEGTTSTAVVDFDSFYSQSQFRHNVIFQYGDGDGLAINMSNTIRVHDNYVVNSDWNDASEATVRTGVGVYINNTLPGGAGLTTVEKTTSRGFLWGYKFGANNNGSPGALYSFELSDSEVSVCTNGVWITNDCRSMSVNNCYIEGLKGGTAILDGGQYTDVTGCLAFEGFGVGIDSPNTSAGGYYAGNVFSAGYRANTKMLKIGSSGAGGGLRKAVVGNTLVFAGSFFAYAWTGSISGTTMTVTAVSQGPIRVGMEVAGTGVAAGTVITAVVSVDGSGVGTYTVSISQTVSSTAMTGKIPGVVGVEISGIDPAIDIIGLATDPRGAWEGSAGAGTGTRKFNDISTDSQGTAGSGLIGLGYAESKNKAWMVPALRRGAIQLKTDPTALADADLVSGVLTLSELSMMTLTLAAAGSISEFAAPNLPDKFFGIRVTNGNATFVHGTKIKLSGSANWTPGANGGLIMFQVWPGGVAWEVSRTAY